MTNTIRLGGLGYFGRKLARFVDLCAATSLRQHKSPSFAISDFGLVAIPIVELRKDCSLSNSQTVKTELAAQHWLVHCELELWTYRAALTEFEAYLSMHHP